MRKRFCAWRVALRGALPIVSVASVVALGELAACHPARGASELDAVYTTPPTPSSSGSTSSARPWAGLSAMPHFVRANARRFVSSGHYFGRFDADIFVSPDAASAYATLGPGKTVPLGAVLVKKHYLTDSDTPGPMLVIEKTAGGMHYLELDEDGLVRAEGRLQPCVACHAHVASQDELFGVPTTGR